MPGPEEFVELISARGCKAELRGGLVVVQLVPPLGPLAGQTVDVGTDVPGDFPRVPPHWVHLAENVSLPGGKPKASELGAGWLKWSRQHPEWRADHEPGSQWLAHIRSLLRDASVT